LANALPGIVSIAKFASADIAAGGRVCRRCAKLNGDDCIH